MSVVILDTTVASYLFAGRPELALYSGALVGHTAAVPFEVVAEMHLGAESRGWGTKRKEALQSFLGSLTRIDVSDEVVDAWVMVMATSQGAGRLLADGDGWIAACAVAYGAVLLTHDADFRGLNVEGLQVVCHAP